MANENKNNSFAMIAVVAIVAIVALVILLNNKGMTPAVFVQPSALTTESSCANSDGVDTITIPEGVDAQVEGDTLFLTPTSESNVAELASNLAGLGADIVIVNGGIMGIKCGCPRGCKAGCGIDLVEGKASCQGDCYGTFCQTCEFSKPQRV